MSHACFQVLKLVLIVLCIKLDIVKIKTPEYWLLIKFHSLRYTILNNDPVNYKKVIVICQILPLTIWNLDLGYNKLQFWGL